MKRNAQVCITQGHFTWKTMLVITRDSSLCHMYIIVSLPENASDVRLRWWQWGQKFRGGNAKSLGKVGIRTSCSSWSPCWHRNQLYGNLVEETILIDGRFFIIFSLLSMFTTFLVNLFNFFFKVPVRFSQWILYL